MAQNALTVTPPNPTPPTNFVNTGATPPNPATFDPTVYGTDPHYPAPNLAPYYDDGAAGTLTAFAAKKAALAVGGTSVDHEGLGDNNAVVTAPGSRAECPTQAFSCGPAATQATRDAGPNASHASSLTPATPLTPTIGSLSAGGVSGPGTTLLTVTGTNFNRASVVNVNGIPQTTNYVSATSLTVTNAPKKSSAGNVPVTVTSGNITTAPTNWVFT